MAKIWMLLFCVALSVAAFSGLCFLKYPPSPVGDPKKIEIPEGASFSRITEILDREGLITNRLYFLMLGKWLEVETKMQAGEYLLHTAMRPWNLLDVIVQGQVVEHPIVIPEGLTSAQIAQILASEGFVQAEIFQGLVHDPTLSQAFGGMGLEGYLFPASYAFSRKSTPEEMIQKMLLQFHAVYNGVWTERADALGMTQHEVVTLASIIEEETAQPEERGIISAVFQNRLQQGMRLQSDPTVRYGLSKFNGDLSRSDLETPSPYNTYLVEGLPPGPISNPGKASLVAALFPAPVDYLYFVSKNNGTHQFSRTLAEHNAAVTKYQRRKT